MLARRLIRHRDRPDLGLPGRVFHDGNRTPVTITEVTRKRPLLGRVVHDFQPLIWIGVCLTQANFDGVTDYYAASDRPVPIVEILV